MTANGHVNDLGDTPFRMPVQLLLGTGGGRMRDVTDDSGDALKATRLGRGLAVGDLDNDGRVDAVIQSINEPIAWLRNQTESGNRFVTFLLEGTQSARDAVGARVTVTSGVRRQVTTLHGGGSYQSAGDPRLHVGLGQADTLEHVEVASPSGHTDGYKES